MPQEIFEKEFDLSIMESTHAVLSIGDEFVFTALEHTNDPYFMEASFEDFKEKVLEVLKKIMDALVKFFQDLRKTIDIKVQQFKLNTKLKELKDIMAKKKAKALHSQFKYLDIQKYKAFYTDFINRYTKELIDGLNKDFKSIEEYEKWKADMLNRLEDFNFKLSDEEQWKLSISINSAVELTEKEAENREKNLQMVEKEGSWAIKSLESYYKKIDPERSFVNYSDRKLKIFQLQNSLIGRICSKLAQCIKTVARFVSKHAFACVTALLVLAIAM